MTNLSINNVTKGFNNTSALFNGIAYRRNELDIALFRGQIAKTERKLKTYEDKEDKTEEDSKIIAGLKSEISEIEAKIDALKEANKPLEEDYEWLINEVTSAKNDEVAVYNLISFYASAGSKKHYSVAFEVEVSQLETLNKALVAYFSHTSSDESHNIHKAEDFKAVKKAVEYILNHSFSLNEDTSVLTRKKVKANNALIKGIIDSYIQSVQSVLVGKNSKKYSGTTVKTLVKTSKNGDVNYSKLLATVVDLCVIPQYVEAKKSDNK